MSHVNSEKNLRGGGLGGYPMVTRKNAFFFLGNHPLVTGVKLKRKWVLS